MPIKFNRIPPQIVRLVLFLVFIVGSWLIAKRSITPPTFGEYGWYRGAALQEQAAFEPQFTGEDSCTECHEKVAEENASFEHNGVSCDACHGALLEHIEDTEKPLGELGERHCLLCHEVAVGRPEWVGLIVVAKHYQDEGKSCIECHLPHQPNEIPVKEGDDFFLDF